MKSISTASFVVGGIASLIIIFLIIGIIHYLSYDIDRREQRRLLGAILFVYILFNALYYFNILPPIPLALKGSGVYHGITRVSPGVYQGIEEYSNPWLFFLPEVFHYTGAEPVYVFTAIFAPVDFNATVVHIWQRKDDKGNWLTEQKVSINIVGGRDGGYRGYSLRSGVQAGEWRVDVKTERGQLLGRINFRVEQSATMPALETVSL
jgi:hypothetical protein